jgi:DNA-directed RNA polymerase specialized sigma24 family protein
MLASGMSEAEAIEGAKQGNGECFQYLYGLHKRRVYSLCLRMTGDVEVAEHFTQEAFLHLFREIASFLGESSFLDLAASPRGQRCAHLIRDSGYGGGKVCEHGTCPSHSSG